MSPPQPPTSPAPLRAVIVDDEPVARRGVQLLLRAERDIQVVAEAGDGETAVNVIRRERPAVVFLDVQMPGLDGFEVIRRLGDAVPPAVVFVTAHDEHALRAFAVHAVDYLLKPFDDARFAAAVERARQAARHHETSALAERLGQLLAYLEAQRPAAAPEEPPAFADRIVVKSGGEVFFLKPDEVDWIEAEGDYMKFHAAGKAYLSRETMAHLEARLDPRRFIRIHRSTIVNLERIRKLSPSFAGDYAVMLNDGTKLKLSRGYQERLQAQWRQP